MGGIGFVLPDCHVERDLTVALTPDDLPFPALLLNPHPPRQRVCLLVSLLLRGHQVPAPPKTGLVLETATQIALDQREAMPNRPEALTPFT